MESESEEFSTGRVGVVDNFITIPTPGWPCARRMGLHVQSVTFGTLSSFKVSAKHDHGYSEKLQRAKLHIYPQRRIQVSSVTRAHATCTDWMQPFEPCVTEISICSHSGWHDRCSVTLVTQQWLKSSHEKSSIVTWFTWQSNDNVSQSSAY